MKSAKQKSTQKAEPKSAKEPAVATKRSVTKSPPGHATKQDAVLKLLRAKGGTTIDAIVSATDWQRHSVRGFLAGTVRKKLGLALASDKIDGMRRYRITDAGSQAK